jgi:hypothetical protein
MSAEDAAKCARRLDTGGTRSNGNHSCQSAEAAHSRLVI